VKEDFQEIRIALLSKQAFGLQVSQSISVRPAENLDFISAWALVLIATLPLAKRRAKSDYVMLI
jgi:hypothetical protein